MNLRISGSRHSSALAVAICGAAAAWLAVGFLIGVQTDEEEYRHMIPSTMIAAEAMQRGEFAYWTSLMGLGVPQPSGQSLSLHPLTPLLGIVPLVPWVRLFYTLHLVSGAAGMWLLTRRVGASPIASAMAVATYALASPAQTYALRDFWPATWPVYTTTPFVALSILALCEASTHRQKLRAALGLGLAAGIIGATGHQGYLIVFIPAFVAFLVPHFRAVYRHWPWWLAAAAIAAILVAPVVVHLATELSRSPGMLDNQFYSATLTLDSLWDVFARPFGPDPFDWRAETFRRGVRVLAFGGPAAALAILFAVCVRSRIDLLLGMLVPLVPLTIPGLPIGKYFSGVFLFRDPLILFAAPSAALALDWLAERRRGGRAMAAALLTAQLVVLAAGAWPFIAYNLEARRQPVTDVFVGERPVASWLRDLVRPSGGRLYFSAGVDDLLWNAQLIPDGLWRNSMFYRGVPVITTQVSFVSIEGLAVPDGVIRGGPEATAGDTTLLEIAGARWVLARGDEAVSPRLVRHAAMRSHDGIELVLYELQSARGAAFVDPSVRQLALARVTACRHDRLLCRDFSPLARHVASDHTRVDRSGGRVRVGFAPASHERLLLVGEMFREGWQVAEPGAAVEPLLGALVGVRVPAGASEVTLRYRPRLRAALTAGAWATMAACALLLAVVSAARNGNR